MTAQDCKLQSCVLTGCWSYVCGILAANRQSPGPSVSDSEVSLAHGTQQSPSVCRPCVDLSSVLSFPLFCLGWWPWAGRPTPNLFPSLFRPSRRIPTPAHVFCSCLLLSSSPPLTPVCLASPASTPRLCPLELSLAQGLRAEPGALESQ